ncbi:MAG TPA: hypothetical protein VEZ70_06775 [Allosphingosinicella sp.]|nr:hypothetical protein [Allosphingosinicella sp.]
MAMVLRGDEDPAAPSGLPWGQDEIAGCGHAIRARAPFLDDPED